MIDFLNVCKFLNLTFKNLPIDWSHADELQKIQAHAPAILTGSMKALKDMNMPPDYINGIYMGICIAHLSNEPPFKEFVDEMEVQDLATECAKWEVSTPHLNPLD